MYTHYKFCKIKNSQLSSVTKKKILNFPGFTGYVECFILHSDVFVLDLPPNVKHIFEKTKNNIFLQF